MYHLVALLQSSNGNFFPFRKNFFFLSTVLFSVKILSATVWTEWKRQREGEKEKNGYSSNNTRRNVNFCFLFLFYLIFFFAVFRGFFYSFRKEIFFKCLDCVSEPPYPRSWISLLQCTPNQILAPKIQFSTLMLTREKLRWCDVDQQLKFPSVVLLDRNNGWFQQQQHQKQQLQHQHSDEVIKRNARTVQKCSKVFTRRSAQ